MTTPLAGLLPNGKQQFIDTNGNPLVGGFVYFFIPGTTAPKDTWQDPQQLVPNTNPVVLDSRGQATIYGDGQYRQVVRDELGNTIWDQLTEWDQPASALTLTLTNALIFVGDGVGNPISTGPLRMGYCPFDCTITAWTLQADQTGSAVLDIWANTFVNDVPPTVANTICGGVYPTLASNIQISSTLISAWNPNIPAGSAIIVNVRSAATVTKLTLTLTVTHTFTV